MVISKVTCLGALICGGATQDDSEMLSEQVKVMVPVKPVANATAIVALTVAPCATWKLGVVGVRLKFGVTVAAKAVASLPVSTEPRPVTWS